MPSATDPALGEAERRTILHDWAGHPREVPRDLSIHRVFAKQAESRPNAAALVSAGRSLSYRELAALSDRACAQLRAHGARDGVIVAVLFTPGLQFIVSLLAILKAGAAYLPLDPADPAERVAALLGQAGCRLAVGEPEFQGRVPAHVRYLTGAELLGRPATPVDDSDQATSESAAYVMFTSGSTGVPKGVVAPHRAILRLVVGESWAGLRSDDVFLLQSAASFDGATFEIWGALLNGACLVIPQARLLGCSEMRETLRAHGVTVLFLTTSVYHLFAGEDIQCLAGPRLLVVGGEALNPVHAETGVLNLPGCRIVNGYGPTENTTFTCTHDVEAMEAGRTVPIGRPIDGTVVFILDPQRNVVPVGVPGELYTGGEGLALGYLGDPALTRERFVDLPAATLGRADSGRIRLYRTGDLARWRPDGRIEFLGRADRQVKLRGFRIELGEIEAVLLRGPHVRNVAARLWPGQDGPRLVAYVVGGNDKHALRGWARERLPHWMVPEDFVFLAGLPLRGTGKIDTDALPAPQANTAHPAPRAMSTDETRVAQAMAAVLNRVEVDPDEDFFSLGGNSLRAIQFLGRLESDFGRRIAASDFWQLPTARHAARLLALPVVVDSPVELEILDRGAGGAPLFFAHSIAGSSVYARVYLPYLRRPGPVYGLRMAKTRIGLPKTLEALASAYLQAMRAVQPEGPYHLAGYSFGAHLVFEIARQLLEAREGVGLLSVIDSTPRFDPRELHLDADAPDSPQAACKALLAGYRHLPLDARLLVFSSESRQDEAVLQPDGGWGVLARKGVDVHRFSGDHAAAVREPAARLIGEAIAAAIAGLADAPPAPEESNSTRDSWELPALMLAQRGDTQRLLSLYRAQLGKGVLLPLWALVDYAALCEAMGFGGELDSGLRSLKSNSAPSHLAYALGVIREKQNRPKVALQHFERAAAGHDNAVVIGALRHLAELALKLEGQPAAVTYAERALAHDPSSSISRRRLVELLLEGGSADASRVLDEGLAIDQGDAHLWYLRSKVMADRGWLQIARNDAHAAVRLGPAEARYREQLAVVADGMERVARGRLALLEEPPRLTAGRQVALAVELHNASVQPWRASGPDAIALSYHWRGQDGALYLHDGLRTAAPSDVPAHGRIRAQLEVACPSEPGDYVLELTIVRENFAWFEASSVFHAPWVPVEVRPAVAPARGD